MAHRRFRAIDRQIGCRRDLARTEQELLGVVLVVVEVDRDDRAGGDRIGPRRLADLGGAQELLQVADAALLLALLLAGGVISAVLPVGR
jgi:hypothetical protein